MTSNKQTGAPSGSVQVGSGNSIEKALNSPASGAHENPLSEREMEVAQLLATGATNGEIARVLVISPHTVKVHVRNVFDKLQVSSRTEASMLLVKRGWVTVPGMEVGVDTAAGERVAVATESALPEPEPLAHLEAQPRPWQLGIVMFALALALASLLVPAWIRLPKSTLGLLSDSGQTVLGKPILNNLPYRWEVQPPLSQPRSRHVAVEVTDEIYVIGGESEDGSALDLVEIFDLATKEWRQGAPMPSPRANLALTISGDDLLIAGGSRMGNGGDDSTANGSVTELDLFLYDDMARYVREEDRWVAGGKLPMPLAGAALAAHGDMLYLMGGWNGEQMQDAVWQLPLAEFENASAADWKIVSRLPAAVGWFGAVMVNEEIFVAGGFDGQQETNGFAAYNVTTGEWKELANLNYPRGGVTLVHDGITILALGGGWAGTIQTHERYDALTNQWTTIPSPISGEWRHFGAAANEGSVYILGGWSGAYLDMHVQFQSTFRALLPVIPNIREEN